jgi:predicted nucleic acid-binding protein
MILVDTSVWINYFAGKHSQPTDALIKAIKDSDDLCTCGLIMTEVLQGIRSDKEYDRIKFLLSQLIYLPAAKQMFIRASAIYRMIRKNGQTIRSPIDCIIASICIEHKASILHDDKDYSVIAQHTSLQIIE